MPNTFLKILNFHIFLSLSSIKSLSISSYLKKKTVFSPQYISTYEYECCGPARCSRAASHNRFREVSGITGVLK